MKAPGGLYCVTNHTAVMHVMSACCFTVVTLQLDYYYIVVSACLSSLRSRVSVSDPQRECVVFPDIPLARLERLFMYKRTCEIISLVKVALRCMHAHIDCIR
jgi:hypothetical protein